MTDQTGAVPARVHHQRTTQRAYVPATPDISATAAQVLRQKNPSATARIAELERLLGLMASARSLFVSRRARHQAARTAVLAHEGVSIEALSAAWQALFPNQRLLRVPGLGLKAGQLPAWGMVDGQWVVVSGIVADGSGLNVVAADGKPRQAAAAGDTVWTVLTAPAESAAALEPRLASRAMRAALAEHRPWLLQVGLATLVINLLSVVTSLFTMQVYDRVVPNFAYSTLWVLASGVLLAMLFELAFKSLRLSLQERLTRRMDDGLSGFFLDRVMALRLDRRPRSIGTLVAQIRDYEQIKNFLTSTTLFALADFPFALFFLSLVWFIGGPVVLAPLCMLPLVLMVGVIAQWRLGYWQQQQAEENALRSGMLFEVVDGAETVKSQAAEWRFAALWQFVTGRVAEAAMRIREVSGNAAHLSALLQQAAYIGVIIGGVYQIEAGQLSVGGLIACTILAGRALGTFGGITAVLVQWQQTRFSLGILNNLLARAGDGGDSQIAVSVEPALGYRLDGLGYAYDPLAGSNLGIARLEIKPGERIAVLGRNGSGKTTLLKLLAGLATPVMGSVRLGNIDLQQARPDWLRSVVGYLPQSPRLFAGTLRDNLTLGLTMPEDGEIAAAAQVTGLDALIGQHPRGLDLKITEGGLGLSIGQRQLVALTRLVLQKPKVWLLDEPAASLDQEAEDRLQGFIRSLDRSHTVLFTTHQKKWVALASRIIMLDAGRIVADAPAERVALVEAQKAQAPGAAMTARPVVSGKAP